MEAARLVLVLSFLLLNPLLAAPVKWEYEPRKKIVSPDGSVITQDWPRAPKGDIRVLLREAMESARTTDSTDRAAEVGERHAEALPFLEPYSHTNHDNSRFAVLRIAEKGQSKQALQILSNILIRPGNLEVSDVGRHVLRAMSLYSREQLARWGDGKLRDRLIEKLGRENGDGANVGIFLLSAFPDSKTRSFLNGLRTQKEKLPTWYEGTLPPMPRAFAANLVLADWGDAAAFQRFQSAFSQNSTRERIWLCQSIYRISNPKLLRLVPPLLNDSRPVKENRMFAMGTDGACRESKMPPTLMRHVALHGMKSKIEKREFQDWWQFKPAEEAELKKKFAAFLRPIKP